MYFWYDPEDSLQSRSRVQHATRQTEANQVEGILMDRPYSALRSGI